MLPASALPALPQRLSSMLQMDAPLVVYGSLRRSHLGYRPLPYPATDWMNAAFEVRIMGSLGDQSRYGADLR